MAVAAARPFVKRQPPPNRELELPREDRPPEAVAAIMLPMLSSDRGLQANRSPVNYAETVLPIEDGLPELKDFPAGAGGSGETMPE